MAEVEEAVRFSVTIIKTFFINQHFVKIKMKDEKLLTAKPSPKAMI